MPPAGNLKLQLHDVPGDDLNDAVTIELLSTSGACHYHNTEQVRGGLTLTGIDCTPAAPYRLLVAPTRYRSRSLFVTLRSGRTAVCDLTFPVLPSKVRALQAPPYTDLPEPLRARLRGTRYQALRPLQQACLLNIAAKASAVILDDGRSCLDHIAEIIRVRQDRVLARTTAALHDQAGQSSRFNQVSGVLHPAPAGYRPAGSFKTKDLHGNLQLTFFRRGESGNDYLVDADIDEARGIEHLFEVVRNAVNGPTNPYDVREILIAGQGLHPGYSFVFA